jgi:2-oxoisovalerate dehydrogenase E1 component
MKIKLNHKVLKDLLRIRLVEQAFLDLFSQGKLNGTVHTCIGQELSALAFAGQIKKSDFVFSNHRCHGHFIAYTKEWRSLILELMGKKDGVCSGVGSSQHLHQFNFFSNGIQGGIMPLAAGFAFGNKLNKSGNIGIVYIGDGTLGEGIVYETLNFISKQNIPLLVVCENNKYAQSTPIETSLAGSIEGRVKAFGIEFRESNTFDLNDNFNILSEAKDSIDFVRENSKPLFHLVNTYRLKAHSKGDDDRDEIEIKKYENIDILNRFKVEDPETFNSLYNLINNEIWLFINEIYDMPELELIDYYSENHNVKPSNSISYKKYLERDNRQVADLNSKFHSLMNDERTIFIGEDILDPYGGAFKLTKGLSTKFPDRVVGTSISEGLIAGIANGLALNGFKPYAEFMFGDFTTLAFDQFINHAAKIYNMFNKKITCPVVFRTPMGGKRGYGPTHSQSIEKHFVGMDTFEIVTLNKYINTSEVYDYVHNRIHPTLVIENKVDYGKKSTYKIPEGYEIFQSDELLPNLLIKPIDNSNVTTTIITYGGSSEIVVDNIEKLFYEYDELVQVLVLTIIDPLPEEFILSNIKNNTKVITIEEGTRRGCIGNNIIALIAQNKNEIIFRSITSLDITIPSVKSLEEKVIVNEDMLYSTIKTMN